MLGAAGHPTGPKAELHVHLEGTVAPELVLELGRRNDVALPAQDVAGLRALFRYTGFRDFLTAWFTATGVLRTADDLRRVLVGYAEEAAAAGAVYVEGVVSPPERVLGGRTTWADEWAGWSAGVEEARDRFGVEVRLTVDLWWGMPAADAVAVARECVAARENGVPVVGLGLGGAELAQPAGVFAEAFAVARAGGLPAVPHAGETRGPESVRSVLDALQPVRLRHGVRAVEEPALVTELAERGVVLDVCPVSNLRLGVVPRLVDHPLPVLVAAGVRCSLGSDDPAFFDTDLATEHRVAAALGVPAQRLFDAAVSGALCDDATRSRLRAVSAATAWAAVQAALDAEVAGRDADRAADQAGTGGLRRGRAPGTA